MNVVSSYSVCYGFFVPWNFLCLLTIATCNVNAEIQISSVKHNFVIPSNCILTYWYWYWTKNSFKNINSMSIDQWASSISSFVFFVHRTILIIFFIWRYFSLQMTTLKAQSQKNFQDIKGSNISRSRPGNGTHRRELFWSFFCS